MTSSCILAWDIGGAHLKAAYYDKARRILQTGQWATPIWQGLDCLDTAMAEASKMFAGFEQAQHVATTTAELVDIFSSRKQGIISLSDKFSSGRNNILFYAGNYGFVEAAAMPDYVEEVASANWHATASYAASQLQVGIMMDVGSTTTDIIPFENGKPIQTGYTDHERLKHGELIYSGMVRTPVMALVEALPFKGDMIPVMAEHFATTADVYRVLGLLDEKDDYMEAADGAEKTFDASARRLCRMIGLDYQIADKGDILNMAKVISNNQLQRMKHSLLHHRVCLAEPDSMVLLAAGCGKKLIQQLAEDLGLTYLEFHQLLDMVPEQKTMATNCATAVSLAHLAEEVL